MKHLTIDQILDFVSMTEINNESINLSATVNGHIRNCEKCLKLVRSFQMIYDEFLRLDRGGSFKEFVTENLLELTNEKEETIEISIALDEFEGYR